MTWQPLWPPALLALPISATAFAGWLVWRRNGARLTWLRRSLLLATVSVLLAGPGQLDARAVAVQTSVEVTFVVDLTGSMAAMDYNGDQPRLDGVAADMAQVVELLPGSRYSVIAWHSTSTVQLPLTTDGNAVIAWADSVHQEVTRYSVGSMVDRPLDALTESLERAREERPQNIRLVFFLSDGENTDGDDSSSTQEMRSFAELEPLIDGGAVLGYGTEQGARMYAYEPGQVGQLDFIADRQGEPGVSRINQQNLQLIAEQMGVPYRHRTSGDSLADLVADVPLDTLTADGRRIVHVFRPVVWPLAGAACALVIWDAIAVARRVRRPKAVA